MVTSQTKWNWNRSVWNSLLMSRGLRSSVFPRKVILRIRFRMVDLCLFVVFFLPFMVLSIYLWIMMCLFLDSLRVELYFIDQTVTLVVCNVWPPQASSRSLRETKTKKGNAKKLTRIYRKTQRKLTHKVTTEDFAHNRNILYIYKTQKALE